MAHQHPTVLIVDDNDDARDALAYTIRAEEYKVETARNGLEALRMLRTVHPCIILLDLMMPEMSGYDFRKEQLAHEELKAIPVVLYSAASHDLADVARRMEVAGYAPKPIVHDHLMTLIRKHCLK